MEKIRHHVFDAISRNDFVKLKTALKKYPDALEYVDKCSNSPLLYACYCGQSRLVSYLLSLGANYERINVYGK